MTHEVNEATMNVGASVNQAWKALSLSWSRLRLSVEVSLWRCGWIWCITLAALCLAVTIQYLLVQPAQQKVNALQVSRSASAINVGGSGDREVEQITPIDTNAAAQELLMTRIPIRASLTEQVLRIHALARAHQVALSRIEYSDARAEKDSAAAFEPVRIQLPIRSSYLQLRPFLEAVLRELPNASLDQLSFKKTQVGEAQIETAVRLSLWLKPEARSGLASKTQEYASDLAEPSGAPSSEAGHQ